MATAAVEARLRFELSVGRPYFARIKSAVSGSRAKECAECARRAKGIWVVASKGAGVAATKAASDRKETASIADGSDDVEGGKSKEPNKELRNDLALWRRHCHDVFI